MKIWCACLLFLLGVVLSGCGTMSGYKAASQRHRAYVTGKKQATAADWGALISEFQQVIDTDPQGPSADDAQYALASSWVWRIKAGDTEAPKQAIEAFQKLIRNYPHSGYVPHAHYWSGRCYAHIGEDYRAITQYQIVESRYAGSKIADTSQLELARVYVRQGYVTRAEVLYATLIESSRDQGIIVAATEELRPLKTQPFKIQQKPIGSPRDEIIQAQKQSEPQPKPSVPDSLTREFGLTAKTIVIDPGHGGKDPGALGRGTLQEKAIVLGISKKLREVLTRRGYTVLMTRDTNRYIPLKQRTAFATQHKADLFLSIHANASENRKATGIETYYLSVTSMDSASEALAARENADSGYSIQELEALLKGIIQKSKSEDSKQLARHVQQALVQATGAIDRGVKHARFVVLIGTNVPAILIEAGFVSNPTEGHRLTTPAYQHKIATAIAQGIETFLGKTEKPPLAKRGNPTLATTKVERNR